MMNEEDVEFTRFVFKQSINLMRGYLSEYDKNKDEIKTFLKFVSNNLDKYMKNLEIRKSK